jgi:hypothetical protein
VDQKQKEAQTTFVLRAFDRSIDIMQQFAPNLTPEDVVALFLIGLAIRVRSGGTLKVAWLMAAEEAYEAAGHVTESQPRSVAQA